VDNAESFALDEKVAAEVITDRRNRLMAIQKTISREKLKSWKGRIETALIEGPSKDSPLVWEARLQGMAPEIDGKLYLTDIELPGGRFADTGDAARVEIIKTDAYDLIGRVVELLPRSKDGGLKAAASQAESRIPAHEKLHRITTGAALRVLG
jgi:ribosomal protein S12 methylthiotransferase